MNRTEKTKEIEEIRQQFVAMSSAVFLNFEGMNVAQVTKLRDQFRKSGVTYRVVKNTLVKQALKDQPFAGQISASLTRMTGIAWSFEDPSAAAKVVTEFRKEKDNEKLQVKAGLIDGRVLNAQDVEDKLAKMPGKQELRASLLATMQAPMQEFVRLLNAPAQNLAYLLDAKRRKDAGEE